MTVTVWVSRDAGALALGAEKTAQKLLAADAGIKLRRNGSRGLYWLEPLIEVECAAGRIAYGPVSEGDVPGLLARGLLQGEAHPLRLGPIEQHPWYSSQQRLTFARVGRIDPLDLEDYLA
ncbi:MAG: formate dehydrogenase, partial [Steroidobacteraceae bacterium]